MRFRVDVTACKHRSEGKRERDAKREEISSEKATTKASWGFMNGIVFLQLSLSHKLVARLEKQEISAVNVKYILREYNFGSDTRMEWNATV